MTVKEGLLFVGGALRTYLLPAILWVLGLGLTFKTLSEYETIFPFYFYRIAENYTGYGCYELVETFISVPVKLIFAIVFLLLAYKTTPKG